MSQIFNFQLRRWSLFTVVSLLTLSIVSVCHYVQQEESLKAASPFNAAVSEHVSFDQTMEARLQVKGERILRSLGEEAPVVVVTIHLSTEETETTEFVLQKDDPLIESMQVVEESRKDEAGEYHNLKKSINHSFGHQETKSKSYGPQVKRIHCLALVSDQNETRTQDIEKALGVALGLDFARGDQVLVTPK
jgi:flagellar biosynthesis/type III secretory pathway M-ring protein FliF/YscJ